MGSTGERVVVISPHSDDGTLSLGAAMSAWARAGTRVELLTVLALDPESNGQAGGWDRRGGFGTEAEAARARREEDRHACAILGVEPAWLPFGSVDYDRHGDESSVRSAVISVVDRADAALLPGFPLTHPDHEWLARTLLAGALPVGRLGFYAEQPYTRRLATAPEAPPWLGELVGASLSFGVLRAGFRDRLAKWRAIRRYRSQLPLLAMRRSLTRGPHTVALGDEAIAWVVDRADRARD